MGWFKESDGVTRRYEASERYYVAEFPWPPSLNHYWRNVNGQMKISAEGRSYRKVIGHHVFADFHGQLPRWTGRLKVEIYVNPPDRRKRDLDNLLKGILDALQDAGLYENDSQIDDLRIVRREQGNGITVGVCVIGEGE